MLFTQEQVAFLSAALLAAQATAGSLRHSNDFDWTSNDVGLQSLVVDGLGPDQPALAALRPQWTITAASNANRFNHGRENKHRKHGRKLERYFINSGGERLSDPSRMSGCAIELELVEFDFRSLTDPVKAHENVFANKTSATCQGSLQKICVEAIIKEAKLLAYRNIGERGGDLCRALAEMEYPAECYDREEYARAGGGRIHGWNPREPGRNGNRHSMNPQWSQPFGNSFSSFDVKHPSQIVNGAVPFRDVGNGSVTEAFLLETNREHSGKKSLKRTNSLLLVAWGVEESPSADNEDKFETVTIRAMEKSTARRQINNTVSNFASEAKDSTAKPIAHLARPTATSFRVMTTANETEGTDGSFSSDSSDSDSDSEDEGEATNLLAHRQIVTDPECPTKTRTRKGDPMTECCDEDSSCEHSSDEDSSDDDTADEKRSDETSGEDTEDASGVRIALAHRQAFTTHFFAQSPVPTRGPTAGSSWTDARLVCFGSEDQEPRRDVRVLTSAGGCTAAVSLFSMAISIGAFFVSFTWSM